MKTIFAITAVLITLSATGVLFAQQPSGRPRRGLDQIDLLTTAPRTMPAETVSIDLTTFSLLGPLLEHSREFERDYNKPVTGADSNMTPREYYGAFYRKANDIQGSIYLIKEMAPLSAPVEAVLDQNTEIVREMLNVLAALRAAGTDRYLKEISKLNEHYRLETTANSASDARLLVSVMLRRINANFSKFRVTS